MNDIVTEGKRTYDIVQIAFGIVFMVICSWISIPFLVPFTLQTLGVFTVAEILGGKKASVAVALYLLLGAFGLPLYAGFTGGIGVLAGIKGGYLAGFLLTALFMWATERKAAGSRKLRLLFMGLGLLCCYGAGTLWFVAVYSATVAPVGTATVIGWCVLPFILPDLLKIFLADLISQRVKKYL